MSNRDVSLAGTWPPQPHAAQPTGRRKLPTTIPSSAMALPLPCCPPLPQRGAWTRRPVLLGCWATNSGKQNTWERAAAAELTLPTSDCPKGPRCRPGSLLWWQQLPAPACHLSNIPDALPSLRGCACSHQETVKEQRQPWKRWWLRCDWVVPIQLTACSLLTLGKEGKKKSTVDQMSCLYGP